MIAKNYLKNSKSTNANKYENELICLPLHEKVTFTYIDYVVKNIDRYIKQIKIKWIEKKII